MLIGLFTALVMWWSRHGIKKAELASQATSKWCDAGDRLSQYLEDYPGKGAIKKDPTFKRLRREAQEGRLLFLEHHRYCIHEKEMAAFLKELKYDDELYQRARRLSFAKFGKAFYVAVID